jgi:hypothetical protein
MPCVFHNPAVMAIHSCLATQHLQRLAKQKPYIFAGDFNIKPNDPSYHLLTTGYLSQSAPRYHPFSPNSSPIHSKDWKLELNPMRSSYFDFLGHEPPYTNNTIIRNSQRFCDTLDYIFVSHQWIVKDVIPIPDLASSSLTSSPAKELSTPLSFPSENEPSDHVMIGAELELLEEDEISKQLQHFASKVKRRIRNNLTTLNGLPHILINPISGER